MNIKYSTILAFLAFSNVSFAQLIFETTYIRRNVHPSESIVCSRIAFTNKGAKEVIINNIDASCECIVAKLQQSQYGTNEGGFIDITFNTDGRNGIYNKTILIETDSKRYTIDLEYIIESPLTLSSTSLTWSMDSALEPKEIYIKTNSPNIKINKIVQSDSNFECIMENSSQDEYKLLILPVEAKIGKYTLTVEAQHVVGKKIKIFNFHIQLSITPLRRYLTVNELKNLKDISIIDARQSVFFNKQHIPTAINLPIKDFEKKKEIIAALSETNKKGKKTVVYCSSDNCPDALVLHDLLYSLGITDLYVLRGGIDAWLNQHRPKFNLDND